MKKSYKVASLTARAIDEEGNAIEISSDGTPAGTTIVSLSTKNYKHIDIMGSVLSLTVSIEYGSTRSTLEISQNDDQEMRGITD